MSLRDCVSQFVAYQITRHEGIRSQDRHRLDTGLRHEHSVEWILMKGSSTTAIRVVERATLHVQKNSSRRQGGKRNPEGSGIRGASSENYLPEASQTGTGVWFTRVALSRSRKGSERQLQMDGDEKKSPTVLGGLPHDWITAFGRQLSFSSMEPNMDRSQEK
jgi:hypothetical protein